MLNSANEYQSSSFHLNRKCSRFQVLRLGPTSGLFHFQNKPLFFVRQLSPAYIFAQPDQLVVCYPVRVRVRARARAVVDIGRCIDPGLRADAEEGRSSHMPKAQVAPGLAQKAMTARVSAAAGS